MVGVGDEADAGAGGFLTAGIALFAVGALWFFSYGKLTRTKVEAVTKTEEQSGKQAVGRRSTLILLLVCLGIFAVFGNFVIGITNWVPSILNEKYSLSESFSILLTVSLAILGIFGSVIAVQMHKKIKNFIMLTGILFLIASLFLVLVAVMMHTDLYPVVIVCLGLMTLPLYGVNNVIGSMAPLYLRGNMNAGMLSGILNGVCYIGTALSSYGLGAYADANGWDSVMILLFVCCILPAIVSMALAIVQKIAAKKRNSRVC